MAVPCVVTLSQDQDNFRVQEPNMDFGPVAQSPSQLRNAHVDYFHHRSFDFIEGGISVLIVIVFYYCERNSLNFAVKLAFFLRLELPPILRPVKFYSL